MVYIKESLEKRLEKLREYHSDLSAIARISFDDYLSDKKMKYAGDRILFLMCENYEDILNNSYKRKLLTKTMHEKLRGLGGLRNVLAHEYLK